MKKAVFMALLLTLTFGTFQDSWAAGRSSTQLATTTNLTNNITKPDPESVPIGTVIAWPYSALPSDGNWLECNGQTVSTAFTDFRSKFGATVPDYRGYFLRGVGGNSAPLGEVQLDAILDHTHTTSRGNWTGDNRPYFQGAGVLQGTDETYGVHGARTANENRPINKAVKYIIKVR